MKQVIFSVKALSLPPSRKKESIPIWFQICSKSSDNPFTQNNCLIRWRRNCLLRTAYAKLSVCEQIYVNKSQTNASPTADNFICHLKNLYSLANFNIIKMAYLFGWHRGLKSRYSLEKCMILKIWRPPLSFPT